MALYRLIRLLSVLLGTFLSFCLPLYECKKLDGYKFPVYSTELCPRNQTEWNERSSAINCTKDNGYLCFPNEKFTQLLEFCYRTRFIWIQEGYCLYLKRDDSTIYSYSCSSFQFGCHNSSFQSYDLFKHSSCTSIGNGCFLAEPSCKGSDTATSLPETTKPTHVEIVTRNYSTTASTDEKKNETLTYNDYFIYDEIFMMPILAGVLIPIILFSMLCVIYRKGIPRWKRRDDEEQLTERALELSPLIQTDKHDNAVLIEQGIQLRKSDDEEQHTETTSELLPLIQTDKRDNAVLIEQVNEEEKKKKETLDVQREEEEEEESISIKKYQRDKTEPISKESPLDQAIFQQWQDDDSKFVLSRACKEVEKLIKSQNLVIVTGNSWSGKSAIIHHVALKYRVKGWTVKPVYNVKEITDTYSPGDVLQSKILFVFNDPIGNESFDEIAYKLWKEQDERLKACLRNNKMLLSSRKYILLHNRVRGMLNDKSCIIDLSDDKHKLNNEEKKNILMSYASNSGLSKHDIDGILTTEEYFPLLCKLYFSDKNNQTIGPRFFKEPFNVCQEQIRNFRNDFTKDCKEKYCALVLLVLCNNQLCVEDIHENDCIKEKFKLALELCGIEKSTAPHTIGDALKTLEGFYVKKIDDTYHFYHDFVMEVTTYVFGTDYQKETIQYADIGFLRRRVTLKSSNDNRTEINRFTIFLKDKYVSDLADRLFNDVFGDRLLDVVLNPCVRNEKVATCFIQKLKECPKKLHNLLAKKQLYEELRKQQNNQESKQSFGSKLEFLFYKYEVQILSVIIVFCHTDVSKHCLETLQRMQNSLKDTSLFSAVCCNGSMDLFKIFPTKQIKLLLMEKWGEYYPIHIASLFHNYEILRELIQVKNYVNLRTEGTYGYTPLMLAAFNTETIEQNNKESRNQPIGITVEFLVTHGADIEFCHPIYGNPLHIASSKGNDHTVEVLLSNGANVDACDEDKETPLHKASEEGHDSTVRLLLDKGADINSCDNKKETPLHKASEEGRDSIVHLLLEKGANINSSDTNEETPLHKAIKCGHKSTVQLLLDKGADINSCNKNKETPKHKAIEEGHESTVQILYDRGADTHSCDKKTSSIKSQ